MGIQKLVMIIELFPTCVLSYVYETRNVYILSTLEYLSMFYSLKLAFILILYFWESLHKPRQEFIVYATEAVEK